MKSAPLSREDFEAVKRLGEAAGVTAAQVEQLAHAIEQIQDPIDSRPAIYTNRAARRARARAERKNA